MMSLNDPRWAGFDGAHRVPFDAAAPLTAFLSGKLSDEQFWYVVWNDLFHQDDVGVASYAAVPQIMRICEQQDLFDYNLFTFAAGVERVRHYDDNPAMPAWLEAEYRAGLQAIIRYGIAHLTDEWDAATLKAFLMLVAVYKGNLGLCDLLDCVDDGDEQAAIDAITKR